MRSPVSFREEGSEAEVLGLALQADASNSKSAADPRCGFGVQAEDSSTSVSCDVMSKVYIVYGRSLRHLKSRLAASKLAIVAGA